MIAARASVVATGTRESGSRAGLFLQPCACGSGARPSLGECPACRASSVSRVAASPLTIGTPGDVYEREAEQVASRVTDQSFAIGSQSVPSIRRVSRSDATGGHTGAHDAGSEAPHVVHDVLSSPGQPLDAGSRAFFEPRFGQDFGRVRVHTGSEAAQSAAAIGARAYTVGHHIVFGQGQHAPALEGGRRLLGHELTHVVQQSATTPLVQRDLIFGSGYANPFAGDPAGETAAAQKSPREWFPSSVDFGKTAELSGGGTGISTLSGVLTAMSGMAKGSLTNLDLIGHANADLFALGGTITRTSVSGSRGGTIGPTQLAAAQPEIDKVRDRFSPNGRITIYGCNAGASGALLSALSNAFKVCARGFVDAITWCLGWQTNPLKITSRGRTLINPKDATPCDEYEGSIYNLTPDTEDCSGTKPKAPDVKLPDRKPVVPQVPE